MIYTVTFNPALDYVVFLDDLKLGDVNRSTRESIFYGGKGINVSTILNTLGLETTALGFIAGFTGKAIEDGLASQGIHTDFIELTEGNSRINVKIKADKETEINGIGPEIGKTELDELFEKLDQMKSGDYLVLAGSIPAFLPDTIYETIMEYLQGRNIRIVVDATGELLKKVLAFKPFLVKPNKAELSELYGRKLTDRREVIEAAEWLKKEGAQNVMVSMAGEGAVLLDEKGEVHDREAAKGTVVNSVGAGDSMVAGFLAGFLETGDYEKAFCMGMCAGSASAFSKYLATRKEVEKLMEEFV